MVPGIKFQVENTKNSIIYGRSPTLFGDIIIGLSGNSVVYLAFVKCTTSSLREVRSIFPGMKFIRNDKMAFETAVNIFENSKLPPVKLNGTEFRKKVWKELIKIPKGKTITYSELACSIGKPKAVRAVASAVASNNIAVLVPCHRVVPKSGGYGKYKWGESLKKQLINHKI